MHKQGSSGLPGKTQPRPRSSRTGMGGAAQICGAMVQKRIALGRAECYNVNTIKYATGAVLFWKERVIGKQVKSLYDLVTVCNERAVK